MDKLDYKKAFPELYLPPRHPVLINVSRTSLYLWWKAAATRMNRTAHTSKALQLLYGLSFASSMSVKGGSAPEDISPTSNRLL
jgi:hypothetical protein